MGRSTEGNLLVFERRQVKREGVEVGVSVRLRTEEYRMLKSWAPHDTEVPLDTWAALFSAMFGRRVGCQEAKGIVEDYNERRVEEMQGVRC